MWMCTLLLPRERKSRPGQTAPCCGPGVSAWQAGQLRCTTRQIMACLLAVTAVVKPPPVLTCMVAGVTALTAVGPP